MNEGAFNLFALMNFKAISKWKKKMNYWYLGC